jgi:hypothetical protein
MDKLVARVSLKPTQAKNEEVLEEDEYILCSKWTWEPDGSDDDESK